MKFMKLSLSIAMLCGAMSAHAAVAAAQANRLGADLTPTGAEKAANKAGTIPAWTGGITKPIAGYKPGAHHPDPFAADQSTLTITRANLATYKANIPAGAVAMFNKYPTFQMKVYPSRRSAAFTQRIYDATKRNATSAKMVGAADGVENVAEGLPFPIPANGAEVIWNHKLKFKGLGVRRFNNQVTPTASGQYTMIRIREETLGLYWKQGNTLKDINNVLQYYYQLVESPARLAGNALLVHETLNQAQTQRQAWVYNPGQRRVRKAPNVGYDNPGTASDGLRTNDMQDMFNGAMDRYDWKLIGKQEMYVPYNSYKVHAGNMNFNDLVKPGHLNPNYLRYELHRVWVVEANLKAGQRHINPKRTFYVDEDSWQIVAVDHYDAARALWRYSEAHNINYYEQPVVWSTSEVHHDLKSGRYIANGLDNNEAVNDFSIVTTPDNFSPQALRTRGTR
jgi:hypothetical protein